MNKKHILIIGANSGIAQAIALRYRENPENKLTLISRVIDNKRLMQDANIQCISIENYDENSIAHALASIEENNIDEVYICHGILHTKTIKPERRLEDFSGESFQQVIKINTLTPMLWLKHLVPKLGKNSYCKIAIFNARVGSISENELGGWYSYRTSKAALNMLLKTMAIELARRAKNIKLVSFHPGTTDTQLSRPFQKNVPEGKLFTPDFVAEQLIKIMTNIEIDGTVSYLDWQGKTIKW